MVYNFLCEDEKTRRNIYLLLLKTSVWKEVRHFFRTVYPNRNHVTTHPGERHMHFQCIKCWLDRSLTNEIRLIKSPDIFLWFITLEFEFEYYFKE